MKVVLLMCFFFQAEDGIRDLVRSRGLGDVYKRQGLLEDLGPGLNPDHRLKLAAHERIRMRAQRAADDLSLIHI